MNSTIAKILSVFILSSQKRKIFRNKYDSSMARLYWKFHKKYQVGIGTYFGGGCSIAHKETTIGKYCSIAKNVSIGTTRHPLDFLSTHLFQYYDFHGLPGEIPAEKRVSYTTALPCKIGNDVWIGLNTIIMDGVRVGDGAVIAAQAVVTKDVPPYAIVGGVPAKIIRYRFSEDIIARLLQLQWWNLPAEQLRELPFDNIQACIEQLQKIHSANPE